VLVRTAWELDQGEVSSPIESFYGYHLVKRLRFVQHHFLLPRKESFHKIAGAIQKVQQEDFLFESRKRHPARRALLRALERRGDLGKQRGLVQRLGRVARAARL
jgi:hypothetical protein